MNRPTNALTRNLIFLPLILWVSIAHSADIKVTNIDSVLVKELPVNPGEGFGFNNLDATLSARDGNAYLIVKPTLLVSFEGQAAKSPSLQSAELTITTPTGAKVKPVGTCTLDGFFSAFLSSSLHLTQSDQSRQKLFYPSLVYPVNPTWKECVLSLAGSNYPVRLPALVERVPRTPPAKFEILKCRFETNSLESGSLLARSPEMQVMVRPKFGTLLSLELKAQPLGPNVSEEGMDHRESFTLSSGDFEIIPQGRDSYRCAGGEMEGKLYLGTTQHCYFKDNSWPPLQATCYFTAPPTTERFTLYYKGLAVAQGVVGNRDP